MVSCPRAITNLVLSISSNKIEQSSTSCSPNATKIGLWRSSRQSIPWSKISLLYTSVSVPDSSMTLRDSEQNPLGLAKILRDSEQNPLGLAKTSCLYTLSPATMPNKDVGDFLRSSIIYQNGLFSSHPSRPQQPK